MCLLVFVTTCIEASTTHKRVGLTNINGSNVSKSWWKCQEMENSNNQPRYYGPHLHHKPNIWIVGLCSERVNGIHFTLKGFLAANNFRVADLHEYFFTKWSMAWLFQKFFGHELKHCDVQRWTEEFLPKPHIVWSLEWLSPSGRWSCAGTPCCC